MPQNESGDDASRVPAGMQGVESPRIRRLHDYWSGLRGARAYPAWADVNLMDIYETAPYIAVLDVEVVGGGPRFRYRFFGTMLVEMRDRMVMPDLTGRYLHEVDWTFDVQRLLAAIATVVQSAQPLYLPPGFLGDRGFRRLARGLFPLGAGGGKVDQVIVCVDPLPGVNG